MRRFQWAFAMLLVVVAQYAFADSISTFNITQATVFVGAGSDNAGFTLIGPGTNISGGGGSTAKKIGAAARFFRREVTCK
jgi:hypothetical protein